MPDTLRMAGALVPGHTHREQDLLDVSHESLVGVSGDQHHPRTHGEADHAGTIGKRFAALLWYLDGEVTVGDGQGATPYLEDSVDKVRIRAALDTAPSGGDLVVEVNHSADRSGWTVVGTVTINSGQTTGVTELLAGTLAAGWYRLDIDTVNGSPADLTVIFVCKQPVTAS